jgi:ABC-type transport system involved in multi-copper enzyme maturation permease subunit
MSSDAITEKEQRFQDTPLPSGPGLQLPAQQGGPSFLREDDPTMPRLIGMVGMSAAFLGAFALGMALANRAGWLGPGWAVILIALGLAGMLFHAAFDRDSSFRTLYLALGLLIMAGGAGLTIIPSSEGIGGYFPWAVPFLLLALLFLLAVLRNETAEFNRNLAHLVLAGVGALFVVVGAGYGLIKTQFLLPYGVVLAVIGLVYLAGFIGSRGISDDRAYRTGLAIAGGGLIVLLITLVRAFLPGGSVWFVPNGFSLLLVALAFLLVGLGLCSDSPLVALTRREIGAFFYSPMAYLCLAGFGIVAWAGYWFFIYSLSNPGGQATEPIVRDFVLSFPYITVIFLVPILTMRLLSEEQRSGTLEVLLTAPVEETSVVASKFLAGFLCYLILWLPFALLLMCIPLMGGKPFDYRPLFTFFIALCVSGAGFVSMGLFFSGLTSNQVASGMLTFAGMLVLVLMDSIGTVLGSVLRAPTLGEITRHMSYYHLWETTLSGKLIPRFLLFFLSMTVIWLYLTVKTLESRKWR